MVVHVKMLVGIRSLQYASVQKLERILCVNSKTHYSLTEGLAFERFESLDKARTIERLLKNIFLTWKPQIKRLHTVII